MGNRKKKYIIAIVIILLIFTGGFFFFQLVRKNGTNQKFRFVKVELGEINLVVTATGTINPVINVLVGSQISGTIKNLYADFNSQVKEGQVIAQIDPAIFQAQVDQAKANVLSTQANLSNARANLENAKANFVKAEVAVLDAKRTLDRNRSLVEKNVIAQATLDTAQTNYDTAVAQRDVAKAQVESATSQVGSSQAQVEQAKAALNLAETNLRYTTIRSPVNGTVISRNVDVGQTVAASLQAPTLFTIAKDLTQMQVDSNVSEADVGRIAVGQEVTFTVDAYPERTFHGKVSEIRNAPIIVQNVVTYDVVIQVNNKDLRLKPGMTANVSVMIAQKKGVLKITNTALRFQPEIAKRESGKMGPPQKVARKVGENVKSPEEDQGRPGRVWVLSPEGKLVPVSIVLGITDGTFSEVISGDLQEGREVVVEEMSNKKAPSQTGNPPFMPGRRR
jgi:HlyD family secretion protein